MAIQIELIKKYCEELDLKFQDDEGKVRLGFERDLPTGGTARIHVVIHLLEDGELFVLECGAVPPGKLGRIEKPADFLFDLLRLGWATPFGSTEADKDGELRYRVEIPLEDNSLTLKQFSRALHVALEGTAIVKALFLQRGGKSESENEDDNEAAMISAAVLKALMILEDPNASKEAKQEAEQLMISMEKVLPAEMINALRESLRSGREDGGNSNRNGGGVRQL